MTLINCKIDESKSRFFDRLAVLKRLTAAERKVFNRVGATARTYARRSMRPASKQKLKQIVEKRRELRRVLQRMRHGGKAGARAAKLQQEIKALQKQVHSKPGDPPKTIIGTIKRQLFYGLDNDFKTVVVGPVLFAPKTGAPHDLEEGAKQLQPRPFMGPAKEKIQPQIAGFFRDAV
jgi:hypothetical protein